MAYSEENGGTPFTMPVAPAYGLNRKPNRRVS